MNDEARMTKRRNDETRNNDEVQKSKRAHRGLVLGRGTWPVVREEPEDRTAFTILEERAARFGEAVIDFAKANPQRCGDESHHQSTRSEQQQALALITSKPMTQFLRRNF